MKRIIGLLLLLTSTVFGVDIFNVPVQFTSGSSLTINSGVPMLGTWDFTGATVLGISGGSITLTGNVTGSGTGSINTTVAVIPDLVSAPGSILSTNVSGPVAPATGFTKWYTDLTDKRFHDRNDAGTTGTTVVSSTAPSHTFATAISSAGVVTYTQPVPGDINGAIPLANLATQSANTVVGNATGSTAVPTAVPPATARTNSLLNIDQRTTVGDANYVIVSTDRTVVTTVAFTTVRSWTLPAASSYNAGEALTILDPASAVSSTNVMNILRAGSDLIQPGNLTGIKLSMPGSGLELISDGSSNWYMSWIAPGVTTAGRIVQATSNGTWMSSVMTWPTSSTPVDYNLNSDGTNIRSYPTGMVQSSFSTVSAGYAADTYLAGSTITINAGDFKVGGQYHCVFDMTKTGAGTATPIITVRAGTLGTTGDAAICTLTFSAGTAAADSGTFEVWVNFRTVGSGTSAVFQAVGQCNHQGAAVGLVSKNSDTVNNTSSGFNSTTQTKIGISFNGGTSFSGTNTLAQASLNQP